MPLRLASSMSLVLVNTSLAAFLRTGLAPTRGSRKGLIRLSKAASQ